MDWDLCDAYAQLPHDARQRMAERLDRSVGELMKRLEDSRGTLCPNNGRIEREKGIST